MGQNEGKIFEIKFFETHSSVSVMVDQLGFRQMEIDTL